MKRIIILFVGIALSCSLYSTGQTTIKNETVLNGYKNIPQEQVFVHHNASLLFAGEYLYYKLYTKNVNTNTFSDLSKVAYVTLVGENKKPVFTHKLSLNKGVGQGDYFIPTSLPSGNYKLIGYTQWMLNGGKDYFFQDDITIINPYQGDQSALSVSENSSQQTNNNPFKTTNNNDVAISLNKKNYGKREQVSLKISKLGEPSIAGDYSLSVKRIDTVNHPLRSTAEGYTDAYKNKDKSKSKSINENIYLPELRGEIITGKVTLSGSETPAVDQKVAMSIPGEDFILKVTNTNEDGRFYFNLNKEYSETNASIQVLSNTETAYDIVVDKNPTIDYSTLRFNKFELTQDMKDFILQRSIYNQVENGYFTVKPDTIRSPIPAPPFYGMKGETFNLDDYTRFSSMKETFVEIIDKVWLRTDKNGKPVFQIRDLDLTSSSDLLPIIIIDGVLVQDHGKLADYNAKKVQKITIIRDKFYLGSYVFQGIIEVETIDGDYYKSMYNSKISSVELFNAEKRKNYFRQEYAPGSKSKTDRVPDFRNQLLWLPNLSLTNEGTTVDFYTSDNTGMYEVVLEGFTTEGKPVSIREIFSIK
jgi:hypothetical protein